MAKGKFCNPNLNARRNNIEKSAYDILHTHFSFVKQHLTFGVNFRSKMINH